MFERQVREMPHGVGEDSYGQRAGAMSVLCGEATANSVGSGQPPRVKDLLEAG